MPSEINGSDNFNSKTGSGALSIDNFMHVKEQHPTNTVQPSVGGWVDRKLNTEVFNSIEGASINTGTFEITLPAGIYFVDGYSNAYSSDSVKNAIYDKTNLTYLVQGASSYNSAVSGSGSSLNVSGAFTLATSTVIVLHHYSQSATGNGNGVEVNSGQPEVFADLKIWKVG